jgi:hypothetical protein
VPNLVERSPATRSANPVLLIAIPITYPLITNQKAADENPEKITDGGAIEAAVATEKKMSVVRYSGNFPLAQRPTVSKINAAAISVSFCKAFSGKQVSLRGHTMISKAVSATQTCAVSLI